MVSSDEEFLLGKDEVNEEYSFDDDDHFESDEEGEDMAGEYSEEEEEEDQEEDGEVGFNDLDIEDFGEPSTFDFHIHNNEPVYSVDFLQGTEFLATGSGDDRALLVDARGLQVLADLGRAADSVISVKFYQGPSKKESIIYLATASMDGLVRVFCSNADTGIELFTTFEASGEDCNWVDWHPNGPVLLAGYADGTVWMWNVPTQALMGVFGGQVSTPITCGGFTPDGKSIVVGSQEGILLVLDPKDSTAAPLAKITPQVHHETSLNDLTHLAIHPASQIFMAGDSSGHLRVYKCIQQQMPLIDLSTSHHSSIESLGFHPVGNLAHSASLDGTVVIYDVPSFATRHVIKCTDLFTESLNDVTEGKDADSAAAVDEDELFADDAFVLAKWLSAMPNGPAQENSLSFSLLLGTSKGRLAIIEARSGLRLRRLKGRPGRPVLDASISVGGILSVAFEDGIISLYQL